MICNCCGSWNARWCTDYKEILCEDCYGALERLKVFIKKISVKSDIKYNQPLEPTAESSDNTKTEGGGSV